MERPRGLYQTGVIRNVYAAEAILAVFELALFAVAYFALYRKAAAPEAPED